MKKKILIKYATYVIYLNKKKERILSQKKKKKKKERIGWFNLRDLKHILGA